MAIYANQSVKISGNANFKNKTATSTGTSGGRGGAIDSSQNITILSDALFSGNNATDRGGAIYAKQNVNISGNATFKNNTAGVSGLSSGYGGAIYANQSVNISCNANFKNNTATSRVASCRGCEGMYCA